ncbi:MAG TPA: glycosyltransferase, partial [Candidatus Dormibacteraeota bacterium]|nr:glycosyltransferase [Candidatus Dormibacteraeota bacterium]
IATFSHDLITAMESADPSLSISVAAIEEPDLLRRYDEQVRWRIRQGDAGSYRRAAEAINASEVEVVNVQHEFGLYGIWRNGAYEDHLRTFLEALRKPVVTTFHTIPPQPAPSLREAVRTAARLSDEIVVMAETAVWLLDSAYGIDRPATVIPHGMPAIEPHGRRRMKERWGITGRTLISTFGLVDPRKGLEYMVRAMPSVLYRHPEAIYLVAGQTHPELVRKAGEKYRDSLLAEVEGLDLESHVLFRNEYLAQQDIIDLLIATDVYVTPYLDPQQITSGTLAYALGAGKAIVSTAYLHALESLADGRGLVVGFQDSGQLASAVNSILDDPTLKAGLEHRAYAYAKDMAWPMAGKRWLDLMRKTAARSPAAALTAGGYGRG